MGADRQDPSHKKLRLHFLTLLSKAAKKLRLEIFKTVTEDMHKKNSK
jgi:hypothetical protein